MCLFSKIWRSLILSFIQSNHPSTLSNKEKKLLSEENQESSEEIDSLDKSAKTDIKLCRDIQQNLQLLQMIKQDNVLGKLRLFDEKLDNCFVFKEEDLDCLEDAIDTIPHTKSLAFFFLQKSQFLRNLSGQVFQMCAETHQINNLAAYIRKCRTQASNYDLSFQIECVEKKLDLLHEVKKVKESLSRDSVDDKADREKQIESIFDKIQQFKHDESKFFFLNYIYIHFKLGKF